MWSSKTQAEVYKYANECCFEIKQKVVLDKENKTKNSVKLPLQRVDC